MRTTELGLRQLLPMIGRQLMIWGPLVLGLVYQLLLFLGNAVAEAGIPTFVPPYRLPPLFSVEYQWWIVLFIGASILCLTSYFERFQTLPHRLALPVYCYILFLLFLVRPIPPLN